ncbi:MAG: IclR family transcriptional regulator [Acidobacteria bacterium]|nr:IclR family transcriptional regulator [Acidobacteriota bacterium]
MLTKAAVKTRRRRPKSQSGQYRPPDPYPSSEYYSKAIGRALKILDAFEDGETTLSLTEISKLQGVPESSLFRILLTLEAHGYLQRTSDGSYRLASKLLFGWLYDRARRIREIVRPFLRQLNTRFNETASLGCRFQDRVEVVDTVEAIQEIRRINTIGRVLPPHASSLGKAIVAFQERAVAERILSINGLSARTDKTITDRNILLAEYDQIRKRGYSVDREESVLGGVCFGAPLFDERGRAIAAISVSIPSFRLSPDREPEIIQAVKDAARQASAAISERADKPQSA